MNFGERMARLRRKTGGGKKKRKRNPDGAAAAPSVPVSTKRHAAAASRGRVKGGGRKGKFATEKMLRSLDKRVTKVERDVGALTKWSSGVTDALRAVFRRTGTNVKGGVRGLRR